MIRISKAEAYLNISKLLLLSMFVIYDTYQRQVAICVSKKYICKEIVHIKLIRMFFRYCPSNFTLEQTSTLFQNNPWAFYDMLLKKLSLISAV